jgi:hypothetical protein
VAVLGAQRIAKRAATVEDAGAEVVDRRDQRVELVLVQRSPIAFAVLATGGA